MTTQLVFALGDQDRAHLGAARLRRACRAVAEEVGPKLLGEKLARLEAVLDEQLGADLADLVRRKAGLT